MNGMMGGTPQEHQGFNGVVQTDEGPVQVQNGKANVQGNTLIVSDDGTLVTTDKGHLVAVVQNGKAVAPTPEILDQLKQKGIV
jgi:hypothetical protein